MAGVSSSGSGAGSSSSGSGAGSASRLALACLRASALACLRATDLACLRAAFSASFLALSTSSGVGAGPAWGLPGGESALACLRTFLARPDGAVTGSVSSWISSWRGVGGPRFFLGSPAPPVLESFRPARRTSCCESASYVRTSFPPMATCLVGVTFWRNRAPPGAAP